MTSPTFPRLFTGCWRDEIDDAKFLRIGISRMSPRGMRGYRTFPRLFPGKWWRDIVDPVEWAARYRTDILGPLDAAEVVEQLSAMAGDRVPVLQCWETMSPPSGWCHRALVGVWLFDELGLQVPELGYDGAGCGHRHPKLPAELRQT